MWDVAVTCRELGSLEWPTEASDPLLNAGVVASLTALSHAVAPHWTAVFHIMETRSLHACLKGPTGPLDEVDLADLLCVIDKYLFPVAWAGLVREEIAARNRCVPLAMVADTMRRITQFAPQIDGPLEPDEIPYGLLTGACTVATAPWISCIVAGIWREPKDGECKIWQLRNGNVECRALDIAVVFEHFAIVDAICALPNPFMSRWFGFYIAVIWNKLEVCVHLWRGGGLNPSLEDKIDVSRIARGRSRELCDWLRAHDLWASR